MLDDQCFCIVEEVLLLAWHKNNQMALCSRVVQLFALGLCELGSRFTSVAVWQSGASCIVAQQNDWMSVDSKVYKS